MSKAKSTSLSVEQLESKNLMAPLPVLMVIADQQDFFYREYNDTRNSLLAAGVDVVVTATTTNPSTPHAGSGQGTGSGVVVPQIALANVNPDNYSAIAFVGGWGSSMYQYAFNDPNLDGVTDNSYSNSFYNGDSNLNDGIMAPQKIIVNNLINEFLADDKYVAGVCHGTMVLAWARVNGVSPMAGKNCTVPINAGTPAMNYNGQFYGGGFVMGQYNQMVANGGSPNSVQGSIGVLGTTADDVVVDGRIITGSDDMSADYFGDVIAQRVWATLPTNQAPTDITLSSNTLTENAASNQAIGTLTTTDPNTGDTFTYSLVVGAGSTDNSKFVLNGNTLRAAQSFNFETQSSYSVRIRTTDAGGMTFEEAFTINMTNVNEAPTALSLSANTILENAAIGTLIGQLSSSDPDAGSAFTYSLVSGTGANDNSAFTLDGASLKAAINFNFEAQESYSIRVRTTDAGGLSFENTFAIVVQNVNEAPTDLTLSNMSVQEGEAVGTVVGQFSASDPDTSESFTFSLVSGTGEEGNSSFRIVNNELQTAVVFDRSVQESYSIRVRVSDAGGLGHEEVFTINIDAVNHPPVLPSVTDMILWQMKRNAANPQGVPVSVLVQHATDETMPLGVAVTGKTGIAGTWEYSATANGPWQPVFVVSDSEALLLNSDMFVRFKPARNVVGFAGLTFRAWDGEGVNGTIMNPADNPVSFSNGSEIAWAAVGTPAFDGDGQMLLPSMLEDKAASKTFVARNLLGYLATEFPAKTPLGIAITGMEGNGTWQVLIGKVWFPIVGMNDNNARLLKATAQIRFVPAANWNGDARLTYHAWNTNTVALTDFADPNHAGFSVEQMTVHLVVSPVNDAPFLDTSIARLFTTDPQNVAALLVGSGDIDSTVAGVAITRVVAKGGQWEYRVDSFSSWTRMANPTLKRGLLLDPWAEIRFTLDSGVTKATGSFDYKAVDDTAGLLSGTFKPATSTAFSKMLETATFSLGNAVPTFNAGADPMFPTMQAGNRPTSLLVGSVLGRMSDTDAGAKRGMAVTGLSGDGLWEFSLDGGRTWQAIGDVATNHLLLRRTDRVRFTPTTGWTGTASLTFVAWDQTLGVAGDRMSGNNSLSNEMLLATLIVK